MQRTPVLPIAFLFLASCSTEAPSSTDVEVEPETSSLQPSSQTPPKPANDYPAYQWSFQSYDPNGPVLLAPGSGQHLHLANSVPHAFVGYGSREYGINLVWNPPPLPGADYGWMLVSQPGTPLGYESPVAIFDRQHGGWLIYKVREYGINLDWSPYPVYEWTIKGAGKTAGAPIRAGYYDFDAVGLCNRTLGKCVGYYVRNYGINLGWRDQP